MKKKIPTFKTDEEAENFVATEDLSAFDLSGAQWVKFEMKPKGKTISLRLSTDLFNAVKKQAEREGIPYQRLIRKAIEREILQDTLPNVRRSAPARVQVRPQRTDEESTVNHSGSVNRQQSGTKYFQTTQGVKKSPSRGVFVRGKSQG